MKRIFNKFLLGISLFVVCPVLVAEEHDQPSDWPLCPNSLGIPARPSVEESLAPDDVQITADQADLVEGGISVLEGNVEVTRGDQQVRADTMTFDEQSETAEMNGNIEYWDEEIYFQSQKGQVDFNNKTGQFDNSNYKISTNRARGEAERIFHNDIENFSDLSSVSYSTCDPEDNFWKFSASEIHLDHEAGSGSAKNAVLRIKGVPVLYTPYISFPLSNKRKTGFLFPGFGTSTRSGVDISTPFYLNLAPNMDATIAPRLLTDRGMMFVGQFRYLLGNGNGEFNTEYLPGDSEFADQDRNLFGFKHMHRFADTGKIHLTYNRVSDKQYFEDFGSSLSLTSIRYLDQRAEVSYAGDWWDASGRFQSYQTVDNTIPGITRPYKRLPQLRLNVYSPTHNKKLNFGLSSEFVYFERDNSSLIPNADVDGARLDLFPYVSFPVHTASTFFIPKIGARFTQYSLSDTGTLESSPYRLLPSVSVDSGIFFEREMNLFNKDLIQTLEPRAFYLFVPGENQSDLPVFDTGLIDFTYSSLFREDRFSGPDRMGDANQFTLGITSRLLHFSSGREIGYVSLGQVYYLSDRNVILPGGIERDEDSSPFVAEVGTSIIDNWRFLGNLQWDPNNNKTEKITTLVQYNPASNKVVNFAYRLRNSSNSLTSTVNLADIEQTDVSFKWPINKNWNIIGRWNYSIPAGKSLDTFGGVEYESCCWGFRTIARRFLTDINGDFDTGIFFQIELKGLSGIGTKTEKFLEQKIPGYQSEF